MSIDLYGDEWVAAELRRIAPAYTHEQRRALLSAAESLDPPVADALDLPVHSYMAWDGRLVEAPVRLEAHKPYVVRVRGHEASIESAPRCVRQQNGYVHDCLTARRMAMADGAAPDVIRLCPVCRFNELREPDES